MREKFLPQLLQTFLFGELSEEELQKILDVTDYRIQSYDKEEILFMEDDPCNCLGIVLSGAVELYKGIHSGKRVMLAKIPAGDMFAEAILFSDARKFPVTIESAEKTDVFYITRENLLKMYLSFPKLGERFIQILSNKILILNDRLNLLSLKNIRQKIAYIIFSRGVKAQNGEIVFQMTKQKLSELIGAERPSLSRELIKMKEEGCLDMQGKKITVRDRNILLELMQF